MSLRKALVDKALSFLGASAPDGDDQFIEWYNKIKNVNWDVDATPWCQIYVSMCAYLVGIDFVPITASCTIAKGWYTTKNQWREHGYIPKIGDMCYFNWDKNIYSNECDHVGIVIYADEEYVVTVEGNSFDAVRQNTYKHTDLRIRGYGVPAYPEDIKLSDPVFAITQQQFDILMANWNSRYNPNYAMLSDIPVEWRTLIKELLEMDAINGGTTKDINPHDVNFTRTSLKPLIALKKYIDIKIAELGR